MSLLVVTLPIAVCSQHSIAASYALVEVPTGQRFTPNVAPTRTHEQRGIAWLDSRRIIFKGHTVTKFPDRRDHGVFIWDTETNHVVRQGLESRFCYASGLILLIEDSREDPTLRSKSTTNYRYGELGKEKPGGCERDSHFLHGCLGPLNMSCRPIEYRQEDKPLGIESRIEVQLRTEHGAVFSRSRNARTTRKDLSQQDELSLSRQFVILVNAKRKEGVPLPIQEVEEIGARYAAYSEYSSQYVFVGAKPKNSIPGRFENWPKDQPQPIYLMKPNGDTETVMVPKLDDWTSIFQAMPTTSGLAYWGGHGRTGGGLFLYNGRTTRVIDRGQVGTFSVSPDGCKIAFAIVDDYGKSPQLEYKIKFTNTCK